MRRVFVYKRYQNELNDSIDYIKRSGDYGICCNEDKAIECSTEYYHNLDVTDAAFMLTLYKLLIIVAFIAGLAIGYFI